MAICNKCHRETTSYTIIFGRSEPVIFCKVKCNPFAAAPTVASNPFDNFTVRHVRGHDGQPVVVNSLKELRAAEKEHGFALAIASDDRISEAPQNESWAGDIRHGYEYKWAKDPRRHSDAEGVSVGRLNNKREALA